MKPLTVRVQCPAAEGAPRVVPPVLNLRRGQQVQFEGEAVGDVTVWIPVPDVFPDQVNRTPGPGSPLAMRVQEAGEPGRREFPFAVYCHGLNEFAEGNSPPRMIIDDPERD